jgi:hypothetical protein
LGYIIRSSHPTRGPPPQIYIAQFNSIQFITLHWRHIMATGNITMTAPVGPGDTATSTVFNGSTELKYDFAAEVVSLRDSTGRLHEFDFDTIATITHTISGAVSTVSVTT